MGVQNVPEPERPAAVRKAEPVAKESEAETPVVEAEDSGSAEPKKVASAKPQAAAAAPAAKPATNTAKNTEGAVIFHDDGGKYCIGGTACARYCASDDRACTAKFSYVVTLDAPAYIDTIQVNAHDDIGKSKRSKLVVKVNGKTLDEKPVYRLGSAIGLKAGVVGQTITIESAHQYNGFLRGGDEAMIWDIFVFGGRG